MAQHYSFSSFWQEKHWGLGFLSDRSEHNLFTRDYCSINNVLWLYDLNHNSEGKEKSKNECLVALSLLYLVTSEYDLITSGNFPITPYWKKKKLQLTVKEKLWRKLSCFWKWLSFPFAVIQTETRLKRRGLNTQLF